MFTNLNVSHLTTQGIKKYLADKGYKAKVENMTRSNKDSVVTFSIKLPDDQAVSQEILQRIRSKSESNFRSTLLWSASQFGLETMLPTAPMFFLNWKLPYLPVYANASGINGSVRQNSSPGYKK